MPGREPWGQPKMRYIARGQKYWEPLVKSNMVMDGYVIGVDIAKGKAKTVYTLARVPGRLRGFLRRIKLDRSTWKFKIIQTEVVKD